MFTQKIKLQSTGTKLNEALLGENLPPATEHLTEVVGHML